MIPVDPLIVTPVPTLIIFVDPLRVIDEVPIVKIPVIRASPFTNNVVPDAPTAPTSRANLGFVVPIPTFLNVLMPTDVVLQTGADRDVVLPAPR